MKNRSTYMDSLKGVGILGVIAVHAGMGQFPGILGMIGELGANCVQLFFIISGYWAYASIDSRNITTKQEWCQWFKHKFFRLAPLYYILLVVSLVATGFKGQEYWLGGGHVTIANLCSHILFLHGLHPHWINSIIGVEWYIADLALFYFLLPLMKKIVFNIERAVMLCIGSSVFVVLMNYILGKAFKEISSEVLRTYIYNFGFVNQLQAIALGILLYYLIPLAKKYLNEFWGLTLLYGGIYVLIGILFNNGFSIISLHFVISIGFSLCILGLSLKRIRLIDNCIFQYLGKYSYGIFLIHYILISFGNRKGWLVDGQSFWVWGIKYIVLTGVCLAAAIMAEQIIDFVLKKTLRTKS